MTTALAGDTVYRIWIITYEGWTPHGWREVPPAARVLEPALAGAFPAEQAAAFLEGFNSQMLHDPAQRWAVAVPVAVRYAGDVVRGQFVRGEQLQAFRHESAA